MLASAYIESGKKLVRRARTVEILIDLLTEVSS